MKHATIQLAVVVLLATGACVLPSCKWIEIRPSAPAADSTSVNVDQAYVDARAVLLQAAVDRNPLVRSHAMEAVGKVLRAQDATVLMEGLQDRYAVVRFAAAMSVGRIAYKPAKNQLIAIIENRQADQRVVSAAIYALSRMGNTTYAGQLGALVTSNYAPGRAEAARVMGLMGEPSAIEPLRNLLGNEEHPSARLHMIEAMARLGDNKSRRILESYSKWYFLDLRLSSLPMIAEVRTPNSRELFKSMLSKDNPPRVRVVSAGALGTIGHPTDECFLICKKALQQPIAFFQESYGKDKTPKQQEIASLKQVATRSLGWLRQRRALDVLMPYLEDPNMSVRVMAAQAVLHILAPKDVPGTSNDGWAPAQPVSPGRGRPRLHTSAGLDS